MLFVYNHLIFLILIHLIGRRDKHHHSQPSSGHIQQPGGHAAQYQHMLTGYNAAIVSSAATNTLAAAAGYHTVPPSSSTAVQYLTAPTASILPPGYGSTLVQYGGYQYAG